MRRRRVEVARERRRTASGSASASATMRVDLVEDVLEDRADERLLGGEAAIQRALADAGAAGDLLHAHVEPRLGERGARGVQDARAVAGGVGPQGADVGSSIATILYPVRQPCGVDRIAEPSDALRSVRRPMAVLAQTDERPWLERAQRRAAGGGDARRRAAADPRRRRDGQDDDAVRARGVAGLRGRAVGADPAADVHAPGVARDAAAGARPGARVVAGARRDLPLGRASARAPARGGARAAGRVRRARRGRRGRRAGPAARGARARRVAHAVPEEGDAAGHLLAHRQRAAAAVGRDRGALPVVRGAPRGDLGAVQAPTRRASASSGVFDLDDLLLFWRALAARRGDRAAAGGVVRPRADRRVPGRQRPAGRPRAVAGRRTGRRSPRSATTSRRSTASARPRRRTSSTSRSTSRARGW